MQKRIGDLLLEKGLISLVQRDEILAYSRRTGVRFGDAGLELGFYSRDQLVRLFGSHVESDFFYLDPAYFPTVTKDLLSVSQIVALGALPLGVKTEQGFFKRGRYLNLGLLSPKRCDAVAEVEGIACKRDDKISGVKVFLILADQFLAVLRDVYGMGEAQLREIPTDKLDPVLEMYLDRDP